MRMFVPYVLGALSLVGCDHQRNTLSQLLPSPTGAYVAVALDCPKGESERATLLKVVRAGEPTTCEANALQEASFASGARPRLAWLTENTLVIEERENAPARLAQHAEVSFLFASWRTDVPSLQPESEPPPQQEPVKEPVIQEAALALDEPLAEETPPVEERAEEETPRVNAACAIRELTLPRDFVVLAGGAYGGKESTVQIDQSGNAATTMAVSVDHPGKPVVLMLGAYEPTIWSIRRSARTTLLGVLISGYHRQVVSGLAPSVPVAIHTHRKNEEEPCGYFYVGDDQLKELNPMAQRFFGRDVDMVYPAREGKVTIGSSQVAPSDWVGRTDIAPESFADKNAPLAGEAGLEDAVRKGLLRKATARDRDAWNTAKAKANRGRLPPVAGQLDSASDEPHLYNAYVVLRPMKIPAGLYGAHSAVFFIPKGTQPPRGNPGHSTLYDFNDVSCTGTDPECSRSR